MITTINLTFCEGQSLTLLLPVLQKAGWHFGDNAINYNIFSSVSDTHRKETTAPISELLSVSEALDDALKRGKKASISLFWSDTIDGYCTFFSPSELNIGFFARQPVLESCGRFTDFSWLLSRIVCPLHNAGCAVLTAKCIDDFD